MGYEFSETGSRVLWKLVRAGEERKKCRYRNSSAQNQELKSGEGMHTLLSR